jgi:hypothetical protein
MKKDYLFDFKRYHKFSVKSNKRKSKSNLKSQIICNYHSLEKGISNVNFRPLYGKNALNSLFEAMGQLLNLTHNPEDSDYCIAYTVLQEYIKKHESLNYNVDKIKEKFNSLASPQNICEKGGVKEVSSNFIKETLNENFDVFSKIRHSIRDYSN